MTIPPGALPTRGQIEEIASSGIAQFHEQAINAPLVADLVHQSMGSRQGVVELLEASKSIFESHLGDPPNAPSTVRRVLTSVYEIHDPDEPASDQYRYAVQLALGVTASELPTSGWRTVFDDGPIDTSQVLSAMVVMAAGCLALSPGSSL